MVNYGSLLSSSTYLFVFFAQFLNLICEFLDNSECGVRLGMFCYVEWWLNYVEIRSGGRFMVDLGFRTHFLSITNDFERIYLISLR